MANTLYSQHGGNTKRNNQIEDQKDKNGLDGLKREVKNYDLELYGEFIPSLYSWITPDEQMERVKEIAKDVD